jgi:hypothetical protein
MKTLEQISEEYKSKTLDGRDLLRLVSFIPEPMLPKFGITLKDEFVGKHKTEELTRDNILRLLSDDVAFGFEKALGQRGLSAVAMYQVVKMWNWILEEGLENFEMYAQYGLPLFKATAVKYGFQNHIGDDCGYESKYACD